LHNGESERVLIATVLPISIMRKPRPVERMTAVNVVRPDALAIQR